MLMHDPFRHIREMLEHGKKQLGFPDSDDYVLLARLMGHRLGAHAHLRTIAAGEH
jgi:hypothetical protein